MKRCLSSFILVLLLFILTPNVTGATTSQPVQGLLVPVEEAMTYAKAGQTTEAEQELSEFHEKWEEVEEQIEESSPEDYEKIESAMVKAEALAQSENAEKLSEALEALEGTLRSYGTEESESFRNAPGAKALLGYAHELEEAKESVESGEWKLAKQEYEEFHEGWEGVEDSVRETDAEAYEAIETNMSLAQASLDAGSDPEKAEKNLEKLIESIDGYAKVDEEPASTTKAPGAKALLGYAHELEEAKESVESGEWKLAKQEYEEFHEGWEGVEDSVRETDAEAYEAIETNMSLAQASLDAGSDTEKAEKNLEKLIESIDGYAKVDEEPASTTKAPGAKALLGYAHELEEAKESVESGEWNVAKQEYEEFHEGWEGVEDSVRETDAEAYEAIETNMGLAQASLNAGSDAEKAEKNLEKLIESIRAYAEGEESEAAGVPEQKGISTLVSILGEVQTAIDSGEAGSAALEMEEFISVWPSIEGEVNTRSVAVYESIENQMTEALGLLSSTPPKTEQAQEVVADMKNQLTSVAEESSYTMWDAAIILLREGLEIILVLSALLAFLKSSGNENKRKWIWGGAGAGVVASIGLAFILTSIVSATVSAENREFMEGITGLIAVVLMFTVGAWLHKKSNIESWNSFIRESVGSAIAKGSLWSLAGVAFITVVREGAETIIFYMGIISDISMVSFFTGLGVAILILVVLGVAIMYFSVKVPVRALFLGITVLIYYLAFKFTGESLHALQVVDKLPAHTISGFPEANFLGMYPTWETTIAQAVLLAMIVLQTVRTKKNNESASERTTAKKVAQ
ncbi:FTR1 family protein [Halobacillus litoralis]|uniref:FTR1 family protein n=1 Tax=Halobacillus litoralis TaxID=45668 RepID=UPI001CFE407C|nr:FTR1 family protein [Halobacillus litoralis]WLR46485.1 FTR1 family protein [Halobacillus litoralis]